MGRRASAGWRGGAKLWLGAWLALSAVTPAAAQDAGEVAQGGSSTIVYDQAFFAQYELSNAEDMLRRIPGVAAVLDAAPAANQRGLGAGAEQILIDGKRMASKSDSAAATLRRIPAGNVQRVELMRGESREVKSEGLVINVVLKSGLTAGGVGTFELTSRFSEEGRTTGDGLISYASAIGPVSYVLSYELNTWSPLGLVPNQGVSDWSARSRDERYFYASGGLQEARRQGWLRDFQKHNLSVNATYAMGGEDSLRVHATYQPNPVKQTDITALQRFNAAGAATTSAREDHYNKVATDVFEFGGELEKAIGPGAFNVIAQSSRTKIDTLDWRSRTEATGALLELGRNVNIQDKGEDVIRASYAVPLWAGHSVNFGGEGAKNFLDQDIEVFFDTDRDGRLEKIAIPTSKSHVEEVRGEFFLTHSWKVNSRLSIESELAYELSRITTNYPAIPIRTLNFLKPRTDIRYNLTPQDRLRLKIERTINQLDFFSFVPTYNVTDLRIDLGNPQILPGRQANTELSYERRLPNDNGTLGAKAIYRAIIDFPGFVPFGFNSAGLPISARGNLGQTRLYWLEANASVRLTSLGLRDALVNARYAQSFSHVIDVFSAKVRKSLNPFESELSITYRQDLNDLRAAYGVDYFRTTGDQLVSDIRTTEFLSRGPRLNLFVEKALWGSYSLRFDAYNVNGAHEYRRRNLFLASQSDGAIFRTETYDETRDRRFALRLRGKF
jgi:hypothetical protein